MAPSSQYSSSRRGLSTLWNVVCLFWLFSSTALAASAVLGIDFGTEYIKATLVKPGIPLDIVLTKDSRRKEASAVAFKLSKNVQSGKFPERVYGSDAMALAARFPGDVYPNLKALLGLPEQNSKVLEYAVRHPALKIEGEKTRGTAVFRSSAFNPDEEPFMVEEIVAMELQSIQKNAEAMGGKGSSVKDIVITIPPYYTAEEKRAIELAADLAGLNILSLISDGLAVGLNYATTRTFPSVTEGGVPEIHLVFDMGAGSAKVTVLKFQGRTVKDVGRFNKTIQEVEVLGTGWDRTLGGDALNAIIVDDMVTSFISSNTAKAASVPLESVKGNGRVLAKLSKEAERIRHVLSANTDTQSSFEGLYEDIDFRYKLSRADFERMTEEYAERVWPAIEQALLNAHVEIGDLDSVILHGGAVRTPFIQRQLEKIFKNPDKIRSNVNADESAVFGAGFLGAGLSPSFRVKEIKTSEVAGYPVGIKWINIHEKGQHQRLFKAESHIGKEKTVYFQNQRNFEVTFYQHVGSSEDVSSGSEEKQIFRVSLKNLTVSVAEMKDKHGCTDGDILAKVGVRLSGANGEVEITKAVLHCELEEEEKKDSVVDSVKGLFGFGKKADQEVLEDVDPVRAASPESSTTSTSEIASTPSSGTASAKESKPTAVKRLIAIPLEYDTEVLGYPQLEAGKITLMKERLAAFDASDRSRMLREESLNRLEAFTYRVRDLITAESFLTASTEAERASLEEKAKTASEWLYGDGAEASREELKARLKELKDIVNPIETRIEEADKRPAKVSLLKETLNSTLNFIESVKGQIKAAEKLASSMKAESAQTTESTSSSSPSAATEPPEANEAPSPSASEFTEAGGSSPTTIAEPSSTTNDFAGLEDETTDTTTSETSTTTSGTTASLPQYKMEDITDLIATYESVNTWFTAKLAEQDALAPNQDPVLLAQEIQDKTQDLTSSSMKVIMRAIEMQERDQMKFQGRKSKTSKSAKSSKTKKAKSTKTKGAETSKTSGKDPKTTEVDLGDGEEQKPIKISFDGNMPTREEIKAALEEDERKHKIDEL
jgi:hypoxia up-regulated 1